MQSRRGPTLRADGVSEASRSGVVDNQRGLTNNSTREDSVVRGVVFAHLPIHTGSRLSGSARGPSFASSLWRTFIVPACVAAQTADSGAHWASSSTARVSRTAIGEFWQSCSASASATRSASPGAAIPGGSRASARPIGALDRQSATGIFSDVQRPYHRDSPANFVAQHTPAIRLFGRHTAPFSWHKNLGRGVVKAQLNAPARCARFRYQRIAHPDQQSSRP